MRRTIFAGLLWVALASCGGKEPTAPAPVATSIAVSSGNLTFTSLLETQEVSATVLDQSGAPMPDMELAWESSDTTVVSVSGAGLVTAVGNGFTRIRVHSGSLTTTFNVLVQQEADSATAWGERTTLTFIGDTIRLQASATDAEGQPLSSGSPTWSSSNVAILSVGPSGLVTAEGAGTATITAAFGSATAAVEVTVAQVPTEISLSPDPVLLPSAGATATVFVDARDASGEPIPDPTMTWSSSDGSVADVDDLGRVTAVADGSAVIIGSAETSEGQDAVTAEVRVTVNGPPEISTESAAPGVVDEPYVFALAAGGGGGSSYVWVLSQGVLPTGLTLTSDGYVLGTPTAAESSSFEVTVTGQNGLADTRLLTLDVYEPIAVVPPDWPRGIVETPYLQSVSATGGDGVYTWTVIDGSPPTGLSLAPSGTLSGSPSAPGVSWFTVQVSSGDGQAASLDLSLPVYEALRVTTTKLPAAWTDMGYTGILGATGGEGGYSWSVIGGTLPTGLSLASYGAVVGTPVESDTTTFTVQVDSGDGQIATGDVLIEVVNPILFHRSLLPGGYLNTPYTAQIEPATGGTGKFTYAVSDGALPPGLSLDSSTGSITGTPVAPGMAFFEIAVHSGSELTGDLFSITISNNPPSGFNLWGTHVSNWRPSANVRTQINAAFAKWESIVLDDLRPVTVPESLAAACNDQDDLTALLSGAHVDDVLVLVDLRPIDGAGPGTNTLGYAFPCLIDTEAPNTIVGHLVLDVDNLDAMSGAQVFETTWHEVGHIMGVGSLWEHAGLISASGTNLPRFTGARANAEFHALSGAGLVPIEADGDAGTAYVHWDEGAFDGEIMTGWAENGVGRDEIISRITIGSLDDLGWNVDYQEAEGFSLPICAPDCPATSVSGPALAPGTVGGTEGLPPRSPVETTLRSR